MRDEVSPKFSVPLSNFFFLRLFFNELSFLSFPSSIRVVSFFIITVHQREFFRSSFPGNMFFPRHSLEWEDRFIREEP